MNRLRALLAVVTCGCAVAWWLPAAAQERGDHEKRRAREGRRSIPEFDPAAAGAIAAVVAGGAVLVARRRKR